MLFFFFKAMTIFLLPKIMCLNQTYGANIVINSNITQPIISPALFQTFPNQIIGWKTNRKYIEVVSPKLVNIFIPIQCVPNIIKLT